MTGEHRANALLQKSFTVDFLTKKKKANEGEIPQYYVKDNHEAIIDPETFEMVQTLMATRKKGRNRKSSVSIFSSKVKCGDCGNWYGPKVWHSNDAYRKVIWQCNHKFDGQKTPDRNLPERAAEPGAADGVPENRLAGDGGLHHRSQQGRYPGDL